MFYQFIKFMLEEYSQKITRRNNMTRKLSCPKKPLKKSAYKRLKITTKPLVFKNTVDDLVIEAKHPIQTNDDDNSRGHERNKIDFEQNFNSDLSELPSNKGASKKIMSNHFCNRFDSEISLLNDFKSASKSPESNNLCYMNLGRPSNTQFNKFFQSSISSSDQYKSQYQKSIKELENLVNRSCVVLNKKSENNSNDIEHVSANLKGPGSSQITTSDQENDNHFKIKKKSHKRVDRPSIYSKTTEVYQESSSNTSTNIDGKFFTGTSKDVNQASFSDKQLDFSVFIPTPVNEIFCISDAPYFTKLTHKSDSKIKNNLNSDENGYLSDIISIKKNHAYMDSKSCFCTSNILGSTKLIHLGQGTFVSKINEEPHTLEKDAHYRFREIQSTKSRDHRFLNTYDINIIDSTSFNHHPVKIRAPEIQSTQILTPSRSDSQKSVFHSTDLEDRSPSICLENNLNIKFKSSECLTTYKVHDRYIHNKILKDREAPQDTKKPQSDIDSTNNIIDENLTLLDNTFNLDNSDLFEDRKCNLSSKIQNQDSNVQKNSYTPNYSHAQDISSLHASFMSIVEEKIQSSLENQSKDTKISSFEKNNMIYLNSDLQIDQENIFIPIGSAKYEIYSTDNQNAQNKAGLFKKSYGPDISQKTDRKISFNSRCPEKLIEIGVSSDLQTAKKAVNTLFFSKTDLKIRKIRSRKTFEKSNFTPEKVETTGGYDIFGHSKKIGSRNLIDNHIRKNNRIKSTFIESNHNPNLTQKTGRRLFNFLMQTQANTPKNDSTNMSSSKKFAFKKGENSDQSEEQSARNYSFPIESNFYALASTNTSSMNRFEFRSRTFQFKSEAQSKSKHCDFLKFQKIPHYENLNLARIEGSSPKDLNLTLNNKLNRNDLSHVCNGSVENRSSDYKRFLKYSKSTQGADIIGDFSQQETSHNIHEYGILSSDGLNPRFYKERQHSFTLGSKFHPKSPSKRKRDSSRIDISLLSQKDKNLFSVLDKDRKIKYFTSNKTIQGLNHQMTSRFSDESEPDFSIDPLLTHRNLLLFDEKLVFREMNPNYFSMNYIPIRVIGKGDYFEAFLVKRTKNSQTSCRHNLQPRYRFETTCSKPFSSDNCSMENSIKKNSTRCHLHTINLWRLNAYKNHPHMFNLYKLNIHQNISAYQTNRSRSNSELLNYFFSKSAPIINSHSDDDKPSLSPKKSLVHNYLELNETHSNRNTRPIFITNQRTFNLNYEHSNKMKFDYFFKFLNKMNKISEPGFEIYNCVKKTIKPYSSNYDRALKLKEAEVLFKLKKCQNILQIKRAWEESGHLFIETQFCELGSLQDYICSIHRFSYGIIKKLIYEMLTALQACHENFIIHGDVKPQNIFLKKKNKLDYNDEIDHKETINANGETFLAEKCKLDPNQKNNTGIGSLSFNGNICKKTYQSSFENSITRDINIDSLTTMETIPVMINPCSLRNFEKNYSNIGRISSNEIVPFRIYSGPFENSLCTNHSPSEKTLMPKKDKHSTNILQSFGNQKEGRLRRRIPHKNLNTVSSVQHFYKIQDEIQKNKLGVLGNLNDGNSLYNSTNLSFHGKNDPRCIFSFDHLSEDSFEFILGDFNISRFVTDIFENDSDASYMAPENLQNISSEMSDIYSLGVIILQIISGKDPAYIKKNVPEVLNNIADSNMRQIIQYMITENPKERKGAKTLKNMLTKYFGEQPLG